MKKSIAEHKIEYYVKDGQYIKTCDQCNPMTINGVWMHEHHTCPNDKKNFDHETGEWYSVFECRECGYELRDGETCDCCDPVDCED